MVRERLRRAMELLARLLGVGLVGAGILILPSSPVGGPAIGVGMPFVLRLRIAAEVLDLVAASF